MTGAPNQTGELPIPAPPEGSEGGRELLRVWSDGKAVWVNAEAVPGLDPLSFGRALGAGAGRFARAHSNGDDEAFFDFAANLRDGFNLSLHYAGYLQELQLTDDWGVPFKRRFSDNPTVALSSVLTAEFPELMKRCGDDETAIVYWPDVREFGIAVLDGGPACLVFTHDPFSGRALPRPLRDDWFNVVEAHLGRNYEPGDRELIPEEFNSEAWWIARGL